jgi:hypothetical protein
VSEAGDKLEHLEWAIRSRAANQQCCLRILKLFANYPEFWRTKKFSRAAQELVAISFSLWRAAFLAEKTGKRGAVFAHGRDFLERLIEDNSISYPQDKTAREWTFNFYTRNARFSLEFLAKYWDQVPLYKGDTRNAIQRWDYCQSLLDQAVVSFEGLLKAKKKAQNDRTKAKDVRRGAKQRRAKVRQLTLAGRAGQ